MKKKVFVQTVRNSDNYKIVKLVGVESVSPFMEKQHFRVGDFLTPTALQSLIVKFDAPKHPTYEVTITAG